MRRLWLAMLLLLASCVGCGRGAVPERALSSAGSPIGSGQATASPVPTAQPVPSPEPSATPVPTATPAPPAHVLASYPIDDDEAVLGQRKLVLTFDRPMDAARVEAALRITPTLSGQSAWPSPQRLEWMPSAPWAEETWYEWALAAGPLAADGGMLAMPFHVRFSSGGRGAPVPILMYHHVAELSAEASEGQRTWTVSPQALQEQLTYLEREDWQTIQPGSLAAYLSAGEPLPPKALMITFDDGYRQVYEQAYPLFQRTHLRPVLFVITSNVEYPAMMDWGQLQELAQAGFGIGSHSHTHVDVSKTTVSLDQELGTSKALLEEKLGSEVDAFCYPYGGGAWKERVLTGLRAHGYRTGYTLNPTYYQDPNEPLQLGRLRIDYAMTIEDFAALLP